MNEPKDFKAEFDRLMLMVPVAAMVDTEFLQRTISIAHSAGPILDPTAYRGGMGNLEDQQRLLNAFAKFGKECRSFMAAALPDEYEKSADHTPWAFERKVQKPPALGAPYGTSQPPQAVNDGTGL